MGADAVGKDDAVGGCGDDFGYLWGELQPQFFLYEGRMKCLTLIYPHEAFECVFSDQNCDRILCHKSDIEMVFYRCEYAKYIKNIYPNRQTNKNEKKINLD